MDLNEFLPSLKYGASISGDLTFANAGGTITISQGLPFIASASCGTAQMAAGCTILADSVVSQGRSVYLQGFLIQSQTGAFITSTGSSLNIQDSAGTVFWWFGGAPSSNTLLDASTKYNMFSSGGTISTGSPFFIGTGGTQSKGIVAKLSGTSWGVAGTGTASSGSNFYVTTWGIIK